MRCSGSMCPGSLSNCNPCTAARDSAGKFLNQPKKLRTMANPVLRSSLRANIIGGCGNTPLNVPLAAPPGMLCKSINTFNPALRMRSTTASKSAPAMFTNNLSGYTGSTKMRSPPRGTEAGSRANKLQETGSRTSSMPLDAISNKSSSVTYCARCALKLCTVAFAPTALTNLFTKSPSLAQENPKAWASGYIGGKHTPLASRSSAATACDAPCEKNHSSKFNHPCNATPVVRPASNAVTACDVDSPPAYAGLSPESFASLAPRPRVHVDHLPDDAARTSSTPTVAVAVVVAESTPLCRITCPPYTCPRINNAHNANGAAHAHALAHRCVPLHHDPRPCPAPAGVLGAYTSLAFIGALNRLFHRELPCVCGSKINFERSFAPMLLGVHPIHSVRRARRLACAAARADADDECERTTARDMRRRTRASVRARDGDCRRSTRA